MIHKLLSVGMLLSILSGCSVIVRNKLEPAEDPQKDGGAPIDQGATREGSAPDIVSPEGGPPPPRVTGEKGDRGYFLIGEQISFTLPLEALNQGPAAATLTYVNGSEFRVPCRGNLVGDTFQCHIPARIPEGEYTLTIHPDGSDEVLDSEVVQIQRMILVGNSAQPEGLAYSADNLHELEPVPMGGFPTEESDPLMSPSGRYLLMTLNVGGVSQLVLIDLVLGQNAPLGISGRRHVHDEYTRISPHSFEPEVIRQDMAQFNYPEHALWVITDSNKVQVINAPESILAGKLVPESSPAGDGGTEFRQLLWAVDHEERRHLMAITTSKIGDPGIHYLNGNKFDQAKMSAGELVGDALYASYTTPFNVSSTGITGRRPETLFLVLREGILGDAVGVRRISGFVASMTKPMHIVFHQILGNGTQFYDPKVINPIRGTSLVGFDMSTNPGTRVLYGVTLFEMASSQYLFSTKFTKFKDIDSTKGSSSSEARAYHSQLFVQSGGHVLVVDFSADEEQTPFTWNPSSSFLSATHHPSASFVYVAETGMITKFGYDGGSVFQQHQAKVDWLVPDGGGMLLQP